MSNIITLVTGRKYDEEAIRRRSRAFAIEHIELLGESLNHLKQVQIEGLTNELEELSYLNQTDSVKILRLDCKDKSLDLFYEIMTKYKINEL